MSSVFTLCTPEDATYIVDIIRECTTSLNVTTLLVPQLISQLPKPLIQYLVSNQKTLFPIINVNPASLKLLVIDFYNVTDVYCTGKGASGIVYSVAWKDQ